MGLTFDSRLFDGDIRDAQANANTVRARQATDAYAPFVASKIQAALTYHAAGRHDDAGLTVVRALSKRRSALDNYRNSSSWPEQTAQLVNAQYPSWLPSTAKTNTP